MFLLLLQLVIGDFQKKNVIKNDLQILLKFETFNFDVITVLLTLLSDLATNY